MTCSTDKRRSEEEQRNLMFIDERARLQQIRVELKRLCSVWTKMGYEYTGRVYREIAMENSDYGGMENVGNTTIISSRIVPSDLLTDPSYFYMQGVKAHEFYHNINGSEVTGQSPFEIWLNEAVTVHIERQWTSFSFGEDFMRLKIVKYAFMPSMGPLALDSSPTSMSVEPEGFNRTQELISAMTYSKAPEFVRMVQLLIGKDAFSRGLDQYHTKFKYGNATTKDWIRCMERASGMRLFRMAMGWLKRPHFPTLNYKTHIDDTKKRVVVHLTQTGFEKQSGGWNFPWDFPVSWAAMKQNRVLKEGILRMNTASKQLVISGLAEVPDFVSIGRGWSFFGVTQNEGATQEQLALQALYDKDVINRYFSYRACADTEKAAIVRSLLKSGGVASSGGMISDCPTVSASFVQLHYQILVDNHLNAGVKALMLEEVDALHGDENVDIRNYFWEISAARTVMLAAVFDAHAPLIIDMYNDLEAKNRPGPHLQQIHERALKHHLLSLIQEHHKFKQSTLTLTRKPSIVNRRVSALEMKLPSPRKSAQVVVPQVADLARPLVFGSSFMTDKVFGFKLFMESSASPAEQEEVRLKVKEEWCVHPTTTESYIQVMASLDRPDAAEVVRSLLKDPVFNVNLAGHCRAVCRAWTLLRKRSLLTLEGLDLCRDLILTVGKVNQMSVQSLISSFSNLNEFDGPVRGLMLSTLREIRNSLDPVKEQSIYNQLNTIILGEVKRN